MNTENEKPSAETPGLIHRTKSLQTHFYNNKDTMAALKKISQEPHHPLVRVLALYFSARGTMP